MKISIKIYFSKCKKFTRKYLKKKKKDELDQFQEEKYNI